MILVYNFCLSDAASLPTVQQSLLSSSGILHTFQMDEDDIPTSKDSCHEITTMQIQSEYILMVKLCLTSSAGDKHYGIKMRLLPTDKDLFLYWPIPFKFNIEINSQNSNTDDIVKVIPDDLTSSSDDWSAYIGNEQGSIDHDSREVGWNSVITENRLKSETFMNNGKVTFSLRIFREAPGRRTTKPRNH